MAVVLNTLRAPLADVLVTPDGRATPKLHDYFQGIDQLLPNAIPRRILQADIERMERNLSEKNAGRLIHVADFNHILRWNGNGWEWGPGENGSGFYLRFDPAALPTEAYWQVADGSAGITTLKSDGTIATITVDTAAGEYFRR